MLLRPLFRPLLRKPFRSPFVRRGGFHPSQVFAGGAAGIFLDPSDITTGFQDFAATTPHTASFQPTGLRLDKHLGLARGSNVVTNGSFASAASWTTGAGVAITGGAAVFTASAVADGLYQNCLSSGVAGKVYEVRFDATVISGSYTVGIGGVPPSVQTSSVSGRRTVYLATNAASNGNLIFGTTGTFTGTIDNVEAREVLGSHFSQSTGAARPEYDVIGGISSDYGDGVDDGYATGVFSAGTLTASMDCFVAFRRTAGNAALCKGDTAAKYLFAMSAAGAGGSIVGAGASATVFVNGAQVGAGIPTEAQLAAAVGTAAWVVAEARTVDLSAWTQFAFSLLASYFVNGDMGGLIVCPAQSTANRSNIRRWLGAKVGLSL